MANETIQRRLNVGSRQQVFPIMIACAITWSIGSMMHSFFAPVSIDSSYHTRRANTIGGNPVPKITYRKVHFLGMDQVETEDMFSATWLQPVSSFLKMDVDNIKTVEDGCFQAFWANMSAVRMTVDWLDFSVEHMSKWWKVAGVFDTRDGIAFNRAVTAFRSYVRNTKLDRHELSPLRETFAIIAFQSYLYLKENESPRARTLTVSSLGSSIASLARAGFGRVVVAGMNDYDKGLVQETFWYLQDKLDAANAVHTLNQTKPDVTRIGPMEVGYVEVQAREAKTKFLDVNMPKGALNVMQHGFKGDLDRKRTKDLFGTTTDKFYWKYVYLTEPDTLLQTKPWVLPQLKDALDSGLMLAPHRLQPVPHEQDFVGMKDENRLIKAEGNFSTVLDLDTLNGAVCCDEQAGSYKPWKDYFGSCAGIIWFECGFQRAVSSYNNHNHLLPYSLIRLERGTGIVTLSATAHGRRCFPQKNGICTLRGIPSSLIHNQQYERNRTVLR